MYTYIYRHIYIDKHTHATELTRLGKTALLSNLKLWAILIDELY